MSIFAHVAGGVIVELFTPPAGISISQCFNPAMVWVDVTAISPAPQPGWTAAQTGGAWAFAAPSAPSPSLAQQAATALATRLAAGIAVTCASNSALNATYALDQTSTDDVFKIASYANQFSAFPSGAATQDYPDASGAPHTFTVPQFVALLRAVAPLVSALNTQAGVMAQGGTPSWPTQTATIA